MLRLKVMPDDGETFEVVATTRDIALWERTNKGASFAGLQRDMHVTDVYKVAYNAVTRCGLWVGAPKDFEATCDLDVLKDDDGDESVDPTRPVPSAEPS